jgi:hypothetical protein
MKIAANPLSRVSGGIAVTGAYQAFALCGTPMRHAYVACRCGVPMWRAYVAYPSGEFVRWTVNRDPIVREADNLA